MAKSRRFVYVAVTIAAIVSVYFLVPESKGRRLEDIQRLRIKRSGEARLPAKDIDADDGECR